MTMAGAYFGFRWLFVEKIRPEAPHPAYPALLSLLVGALGAALLWVGGTVTKRDAGMDSAPRESSPRSGSATLPSQPNTADNEIPTEPFSWHSEAAFSILWSDKREVLGFGLYSYLLFGSVPRDETDRARDLAAIDAISKLPPVGQMLRYFRPQQLNITYVPIQRNTAHSWRAADIQASTEMLKAYDFARARSLLDSVDSSLRDGPYIISVIRPLSQEPIRQKYLFQDLSSATPRVVRQWVVLFRIESARPNFWEAEGGERFVLELRSDVDVVAHDIMPNIPSNIADMIGWHPARDAK